MVNIQIHNEGLTQKTNSKNVAEVFGKSHRHVIEKINDLDCSDEFRSANFRLSSYTSPQNKVLKCFDMTKDGFTFLCMGFTGSKAAQFKEAYINEFNRMAESLNSISSRINKLEIEGKEIKQIGREWSELGREVRKAKDDHKAASDALMSEVQLKLNY